MDGYPIDKAWLVSGSLRTTVSGPAQMECVALVRDGEPIATTIGASMKNSEAARSSTVGNIGLYYVCYRQSLLDYRAIADL